MRPRSAPLRVGLLGMRLPLRLGRCGWLAAPVARQLRMEADGIGLLTNDNAELALVVAVVGHAGGLGFFPDRGVGERLVR